MGGYLLVLLWPHWLAPIIGAFLYLAWSALSVPAMFTVVANSLERNRHTMGVGIQSLVRRIPMIFGPLIGGWLVMRYGWELGVRFGLAGCIGLAMAATGFQWFMLDSASRKAAAAGQQSRYTLREVIRSFSPALRELLMSDILIRFCERIPYAFVILWAVDHIGANAQQFGWLTALEMGTAMLCYIPVAHLADRYGRRPFVLATFMFFTLFPLALLWADSMTGLAIAFFIRGLKEFGEPARKALIIGEAVPAIRSRTYGAYYLIRDCVVTSGSLLGAALWRWDPRANFMAAAVCGALGTVVFARLMWRQRAHRSAGAAVRA